jgi:hypothetical protein
MLRLQLTCREAMARSRTLDGFANADAGPTFEIAPTFALASEFSLEFSAGIDPAPLPAALPLFAGGLTGLGRGSAQKEKSLRPPLTTNPQAMRGVTPGGMHRSVRNRTNFLNC